MSESSLDKQRIIECLSKIKYGSVSRIVKATYTESTNNLINDLVRDKKIIRSGYGKNIYYTLPKEMK